MLDYTKNKYEKESYILNYEKVDDKIIINYADGKVL